MNELTLSKQSLLILKELFSKESKVNIPVGLAQNIIEIQNWTEQQLALQFVQESEQKLKEENNGNTNTKPL